MRSFGPCYIIGQTTWNRVEVGFFRFDIAKDALELIWSLVSLLKEELSHLFIELEIK